MVGLALTLPEFKHNKSYDFMISSMRIWQLVFVGVVGFAACANAQGRNIDPAVYEKLVCLRMFWKRSVPAM